MKCNHCGLDRPANHTSPACPYCGKLYEMEATKQAGAEETSHPSNSSVVDVVTNDSSAHSLRIPVKWLIAAVAAVLVIVLIVIGASPGRKKNPTASETPRNTMFERGMDLRERYRILVSSLEASRAEHPLTEAKNKLDEGDTAVRDNRLPEASDAYDTAERWLARAQKIVGETHTIDEAAVADVPAESEPDSKAKMARSTQDMLDAFDAEKYQEAFTLSFDADRSDCRVQTMLGLMYENGKGTTQNLRQAMEWYRKAAENETPHFYAMARLGLLYFTGSGGLPEDETEAIRWWQRAAEGGNIAEAQFFLGQAHRLGWGNLSKDPTEAFHWYRRAAENEFEAAYPRLGNAYEYGQGIAENLAEAAKWYKKGVDTGDPESAVSLGYFILNGEAGFQKDAKRAVSLFRDAAEKGDSFGQYAFGMAYKNGLGNLAKDMVEALRWFRPAAEAGVWNAQIEVGMAYEYGEGGVEKDDIEAIRWYRKAAEGGSPVGQAYLGIAYEDGQGGLPKDLAEAVRWFKKAADQGNGFAQWKMGDYCKNGWGGVPKNLVHAVNWYKLSAEQQNPRGIWLLGTAYVDGIGGLERNESKAAELFQKAASMGDAFAQNSLGRFYELGRGGLAKNTREALSWYAKSAEQDNAYACYHLGRFYENGLGGLHPNKAQALDYYRRAVRFGFGDAETDVRRLSGY